MKLTQTSKGTMDKYQFDQSYQLLVRLADTNSINAELIDDLYQWNTQAFGPGRRTSGIIDHIRQELDEINKSPGDPEEWVDVLLLALNGLQRLDLSGHQIIQHIFAKIAKNARRQWPDWQTRDPEKAINHDRNVRD